MARTGVARPGNTWGTPWLPGDDRYGPLTPRTALWRPAAPWGHCLGAMRALEAKMNQLRRGRRAWTKLVTLAMIGSVLGVLLLRLHVQSAKFQASANNLRELRAAALLKCKSRCSGLGMCKGFSFYYSSAIHGYACSPKSSVCADKPLKCDLLGFCFYIRKPQQYLQVCNCKKKRRKAYICIHQQYPYSAKASGQLPGAHLTVGCGFTVAGVAVGDFRNEA